MDIKDDRAGRAAIAKLNNTAELGSRNINVKECQPHGYQAALRKKRGEPPPHTLPGFDAPHARPRSPHGRDAAPRRRDYSPPPPREPDRGGRGRAGSPPQRRPSSMPDRHLFVGNIPTSADERGMSQHFSSFGVVESVKILPQKGPMLTAFVDFVDKDDAMDAHESEITFDGVLLKTDLKCQFL